jgi:ribosomal protein S18 acetylase RimI-like enzyme
MSIRIREMTAEDVPTLVRLHAEVFPGYNSTALGRGYLRALYRTLATHPSCLSVVAEEDGDVLGWIGGIKNYGAYNRALVRACLPAAPAIFLAALFRRPRLLLVGLTFVRRVTGWTLRRKRAAAQATAPTSSPPPPRGRTAHLLVIGVAVGCQRTGVGQTMMAEFHRRLAAEGFATCSLSTYVTNDGGIGAFKKAGYRLSSTRGEVHYFDKDLTEEREETS